jgi:hypothetical protein
MRLMISKTALRFPGLLLVAGSMLLASCGGSSTDPGESVVEVIMPPASPTAPVADWTLPAQAYDDRSFYATTPGYTPEQYDEIAAMPMAMFQLRWCLSEEAVPVIARLRALNPRIVIIGVHSVLSAPESWSSPNARARFPMAAEIHDLLVHRTVTTDLGEPILMWDDAPMINPMRGREIDQVLLTRILNVISRYATMYDGHIDGIMHDYTSGRPWAYPAGDESYEGIIDFDEDGVAFDEDPDEQAAWRGWQYALADQLQERFGEGFIQIANGRLPLDDQEMARRLAGVIFQKFPLTVWDMTAQQGLDHAIRMREDGWLTPRRGQHWNYYWAATFSIDGQTDFRRWASLLTGDFYETNTTTASTFRGADPDRQEYGAPLGPLTVTRDGDDTIYAREFEGGTVSIVFNALGNTSAMGVSPR